MKKLRFLAALTVVALSLAVYAPIAFAQSVPMLFTGTATFDGTPVAAGATIEAYSAAGALVGTTTTGGSGQAANAFTLLVNNPALEDTQVFFYLVLLSGARSPAAGVQARYDTVGGTGRATVLVAAVAGAQPTATAPAGTATPRPATPTPGPVGDYKFSSAMLAGMIGGGLLLLATGGMMLRRKNSV